MKSQNQNNENLSKMLFMGLLQKSGNKYEIGTFTIKMWKNILIHTTIKELSDRLCRWSERVFVCLCVCVWSVVQEHCSLCRRGDGWSPSWFPSCWRSERWRGKVWTTPERWEVKHCWALCFGFLTASLFTCCREIRKNLIHPERNILHQRCSIFIVEIWLNMQPTHLKNSRNN